MCKGEVEGGRGAVKRKGAAKSGKGRVVSKGLKGVALGGCQCGRDVVR